MSVPYMDSPPKQIYKVTLGNSLHSIYISSRCFHAFSQNLSMKKQMNQSQRMHLCHYMSTCVASLTVQGVVLQRQIPSEVSESSPIMG